MVDDPSLKNVIVILIMDVSSILSDEEILHLCYISKLFNEVIIDVFHGSEIWISCHSLNRD
jgi:hypothetical protein